MYSTCAYTYIHMYVCMYNVYIWLHTVHPVHMYAYIVVILMLYLHVHVYIRQIFSKPQSIKTCRVFAHNMRMHLPVLAVSRVYWMVER